MGKPVGRWFVQMESKIPSWEFPFGLSVYHLINRNQLTERAYEFDIFEMAAEIVVLYEIVDASIDEELPLDEEDGEFHLKGQSHQI